MNRIDMISVSDKKGLDRVYILLHSVKKTKQDDTVVYYKLVIEDLDDKVKQYFADLQSDDFKIEFIDTAWFKNIIHSPRWSYLYYVRCLFPIYFQQLDRLLYVDTDLVFARQGIEELWNEDLTKHSLGAVQDIMVNTFPNLLPEQRNCKTKCYINSGVCLFNLKRIRNTGKAQQLANWVKNWNKNELMPILMDQSLLNYLFRDGEIKELKYKYNDYSLVLNYYVFPYVKKYLKQTYGYNEPAYSVQDAVILHFLGQMKPWKQNNEKTESISPYVKACKQIWKDIQKQLGKKYEAEEVQTV